MCMHIYNTRMHTYLDICSTVDRRRLFRRPLKNLKLPLRIIRWGLFGAYCGLLRLIGSLGIWVVSHQPPDMDRNSNRRLGVRVSI